MEIQNEYKFKKAKKRVEAIKSFYTNLLTYCIVIPLLALLNYNTTSFPWVLFPTIGWGIGLFGHWANVYGYNPILGKNWEERKIKELMKSNEF